MTFSSILKELREERELTQKQLAIYCNLSPQCICALEQGTRNPTGSTVVVLAKFFDVSADYLLGLENDYGARVAAPTVAAINDDYSAEERKLVVNYRELNPSGKKLINETIKTLLTASGRSEQSSATGRAIRDK